LIQTFIAMAQMEFLHYLNFIKNIQYWIVRNGILPTKDDQTILRSVQRFLNLRFDTSSGRR
jgi:hypothetical protein